MSSHIRRLSLAWKLSKPAQPEPVTSTETTSENALQHFLERTKRHYLSDIEESRENANEWLMVMGNEAGDLDSIASSVGFAWLSSLSNTTVPYIQINKEDLALRAENLYALQLAGIDNPQEQLLLANNLASYTPFPSARFGLVDHNRLGSLFVSDAARVEAVIDHHEDEHLYLDIADPRIVAPAGSCSSHVANLCPFNLPREIATLLLCAILIDTNGLKPSGKAVQADRDAVLRLLPSARLELPSSFSSASTDGLHDIPSIISLSSVLATKKADVSHLSARDLLRRDYKEYTYTLQWHPDKPTVKVGLSTVPLRLKDWGSKGKLFCEGVGYMQARGLQVLGVLTTFKKTKKNGKEKTKHCREMAWIVLSDTGLDKRLWQGLEEDQEIRVERHKFKTGKVVGEANVKVYKQGNAGATRKTTAPLLKRILESPS
ncbi:DHH phosphoesterase [Guyanagaster necrorhizus]|uniref:DHH phosphoesterase n=1 Tax=Guyanagaster necrorhizus TaxID=856835 RepID=A0A9P7VZ38_9AGAR|nr:DHH phosphoesterase [Guyanagaster necrorhizus MCA 3950]KAG7449604.1 DHH phosphoesterase [Guyanagaster necrorhizus MCA 3950]